MSTLIYDPDCGFCTSCAAFAGRFLHLGCRIIPGDRAVLAEHGVSPDRFAHALPFVLESGQVAYGALAVGLALHTSGKRVIRGLGTFLLAPGIRPAAETLYSLVAKNRYRLPGSRGTCGVKATTE